jgi:hypothetical protein
MCADDSADIRRGIVRDAHPLHSPTTPPTHLSPHTLSRTALPAYHHPSAISISQPKGTVQAPLRPAGETLSPLLLLRSRRWPRDDVIRSRSPSIAHCHPLGSPQDAARDDARDRAARSLRMYLWSGRRDLPRFASVSIVVCRSRARRYTRAVKFVHSAHLNWRILCARRINVWYRTRTVDPDSITARYSSRHGLFGWDLWAPLRCTL